MFGRGPLARLTDFRVTARHPGRSLHPSTQGLGPARLAITVFVALLSSSCGTPASSPSTSRVQASTSTTLPSPSTTAGPAGLPEVRFGAVSSANYSAATTITFGSPVPVDRSGLSSAEVSQCSNISTGGGLADPSTALVVPATLTIDDGLDASSSASQVIADETLNASGFDPGALYLVVQSPSGSQCFDPLSNGMPGFRAVVPANQSSTFDLWFIFADTLDSSRSALGSWTLAAPTVEVDDQAASGQIFGSRVVSCGGTPYIVPAGPLPTQVDSTPCSPTSPSAPASY
jgi:hypothetical protein